MIHSKGANGSTAELVIVQVLQGFGGGFSAVLAQTAAQGSVAHQDLAAVTAFVLLFAEIGNSIGSAICSALWRNIMPGQLTQNLVNTGLVDATIADTIYESYIAAAAYPAGGDIKNAIIAS